MPEITPSRYMVQAGWGDVPHLSEDAKRELYESTPAHLQDARSKGIPTIGSGAIYPIEESLLKVMPFPLPLHWPRAYALDVGWKCTAALWGAHDKGSDTLYLYSEHYRGHAEPATHASAIKARGEWIPGVIDPASRGRSQRDGSQLIADYRAQGCLITPSRNAVEAGIEHVWLRMHTGRLKVFSTLTNWFAEWRLYRRDENGQIVKEYDHAMDCMRYLCLSGLAVAICQPMAQIGPNPLTAGIADRRAGY